jgi:hypothetical protein
MAGAVLGDAVAEPEPDISLAVLADLWVIYVDRIRKPAQPSASPCQ